MGHGIAEMYSYCTITFHSYIMIVKVLMFMFSRQEEEVQADWLLTLIWTFPSPGWGRAQRRRYGLKLASWQLVASQLGPQGNSL